MTRLACATLLVLAGSAAAQKWESPPAIFLSPVVPPGVRLLSQPAVQADVGLTAEQKAEVVALNHLWGQSPRTWETALVPPEVARAAVAHVTQEFLARGLTKEQRTRLDQVVFQLREKEFGAHAAFAMAARDLGLRADQLDDVHNLKGLRVEEIAKHVTSGERFERVKTKVAATNGETFEKMTEMLTRTQRERLRDLKGKPFEAKLDLAGQAEAPAPRKYAPHLFGMYDHEIVYLAHPAVRAELKVSDEKAKFLDMAVKFQERDPEKQHELIDLVRTHHLTPEQRARLDEIMLQRRELASPEVMCGHPAAVAALKLSPVQLRQLREGKSVPDVLTKDQLARRRELLGKPFDLPADIEDPLIGRPARVHVKSPDFAFARNFLVLANRIGLSEEQIKKFRELAEDEPKIKELIQRELSLSDTPPVAGATRGLTTMTAVMDQYQMALEEQCWSVLDAQQQSTARKIFGRGR